MLTEVKSLPSRYLYEALLSNGTTIFVKSGGEADGADGHVYRAVTHENDDGDLVQDGWELSKPTEQ